MSKSLNTELFWDDWYRDTDKLTYAEKGLWIDLIGRTVNNPAQGEFITTLQNLSKSGACDVVWKLLLSLGSKGTADVFTEDANGIPTVAVTCSNVRSLSSVLVDDYTQVRVVCRRVVRESENRKKAAIRMALRRDTTNEHSANTARTQREQAANTARTGSERDANIKWLLPRAIISPSSPSSSSLLSEDSGNQEPPKRNRKPSEKRTGRVEFNSELMVRIGKWFGMKPTTLWTEEQAIKLKMLAPLEDEIVVHEEFYAIEDIPWRNYRRRDLSTQLNNWVDDLIKHREWTQEWSSGCAKRQRKNGCEGSVAVV